MKKLAVFVAILFVFSMLSMLSFASAFEQNLSYGSTTGASVTVTSLNYEPYPVEPGETFNINLILKNIGTDFYTNDATCKIVNNFPFSAYSQQQQSIGKLAPGREFSLNFQIKVDEKAIQGQQNLEVWCTDDPNKDSWTISKIPIEIQIRYSVLNINISTTPEMLPIGKLSTINVQITNNAESIIKDVLAEIKVENMPIAPAGGVTIKKIRDLAKGDTGNIAFDIMTMPDTTPGLYKIPLTINYTDSSGDKKSFSTYIALMISDKPSYYIIVESMQSSGSTKDITLKFVNNGASDLKFFNVEVLDSRQVKVKSNNIIYIGDLDSDDYLTETFSAQISASKTIIPLKITYKDALSNDYTDFVNVTWDTSKIKDTTARSALPLIVLVLLVGGYLYYRYRKKKKIIIERDEEE
jgi:hypothetical protein